MPHISKDIQSMLEIRSFVDHKLAVSPILNATFYCIQASAAINRS